MSGSLLLDGDELVLKTAWNEQLVAEQKAIPGRRWESSDKTNRYPLSSITPLRSLCEKWGIAMQESVKAIPDSEPVIPEEEIPGVTVVKDTLLVRFPHDPEQVDEVRTIPGARWDFRKKAWKCPMASAARVVGFANKHNLPVPTELQEQTAATLNEAKELYEASLRLVDEGLIDAIHHDMQLHPYQKAGVEYLVRTKRAFLGDDVGLGKTAQALCALVHDWAFPAIVVCPPSLKENWKLEAQRWFPFLNVQTIYGRKSAPLPKCHIAVFNYDILDGRVQDIKALAPRALVCDESHRIQNAEAKYRCPECGHKAGLRANSRRCPECKAMFAEAEEYWTVKRGGAVIDVARMVPDDGLVFMLSGTFVTGGPGQLIPQLIAIDRLDRFGGKSRFQHRFGKTMKDAKNTVELNRRLREICLVRRAKKDVFAELPEVQNAPQMLSIDAKSMAEYREVEDDVVEYVANRARELAEEAGEDGDDAYWEKRLRAEAAKHLIRINALRHKAAEIKIASIIDWVENFLENDEKLILFAEHVDMVEKIADHFGDKAVKIRGGVKVKDRPDIVKRFQEDPTCRLFVGNFDSASEGLTLTASSNVAFAELEWRPATHHQCVGRAYGRANDLHGATAWYLLAPSTIDEDMYALLQQVQKVVDAVVDGTPVEENRNILPDLLINIAHKRMAA